MSVRCSSRAGSCSSWLMLSNPTKIERVCRFGVGFFYGRKKVKREKRSSCWWKIVINRSTCTILFLSTPRGARYCCSCRAAGVAAVPPRAPALPFRGFGSKTRARKVAVKSLELELLRGSASEGCSYFFIAFFRLQAAAWK